MKNLKLESSKASSLYDYYSSFCVMHSVLTHKAIIIFYGLVSFDFSIFGKHVLFWKRKMNSFAYFA